MMEMSRIKNTKSKDVLEEIICENLDKCFEELEKLNKLKELDSESKKGVISERKRERN